MNNRRHRRLLTVATIIIAVGLSLTACNTTKATTDTTKNFLSSTTPGDLFTQDGLVVQEQKIKVFAGVAYENIRQEAAAGGGQYVYALAVLYQIPQERQREFAQLLQAKHSDLFGTSLSEDRTAHLRMVNALNRELIASVFLR